MERFWNKVDKTDTCWNWRPGSERYGRLKRTGSRQNVLAHRLSWEMHNGEIPEGLEVGHRCDNTRCVNPDHLFLCTHAENMADMANKGRARPGQHPGPKFNRDEIKAYKQQGVLSRDIALFMGCSLRTVTGVQ